MKILFAGRDNPFNRGIINWLSERFTVTAVYFLEPDRFSLSARWRKTRRRARRNGWLATVDELAFHAVDRLLIRQGESRLWKTRVPAEFQRSQEIRVPSFNVRDVHSPEWLARTRELAPDIVFSICGSVIFRNAFYSIPRMGTFVLHEGLTPEYMGLHTPLWALLKREPQYIGYTLLRVDDSIDGGEVLSQARYEVKPDEHVRHWSYVGHKAIVDNLPHIESALRHLETHRGFVPLDLGDRRNGYYSWMRLSEFVRHYRAGYDDHAGLDHADSRRRNC